MKYIDLVVQSLLIGAAAVILIANFFYRDLGILIGYDQLLLGAWQLSACIISLIAYPSGNSARRMHLVLSGIYLLSLFIAANSGIAFPGWLVITYVTVPAWALGIFYYFISLRGVFPKLKQTKFLPHLSF
jgi:hypothetical protein